MEHEMIFNIHTFKIWAMKTFPAIVLFGIIGNTSAEILTFPSFRIAVEDGWTHSLEKRPNAPSEMGELISIYHPNGIDVLRLQTYSAPNFVSKEILRNMTNVDQSTSLAWNAWGDYSGYQYGYSEGGVSYRQWWLVNKKTIIFVVYESRTEPQAIEVYEVDEIVNSMTVSEP